MGKNTAIALIMLTSLLADVQAEAVEGNKLIIPLAGQATWEDIIRLDSIQSSTVERLQRVIPQMPGPEDREIASEDNRQVAKVQSMTQVPHTEPAPADASAGPEISRSFQALADNNTVIPPDTYGAAGPNHLMTMLNSQVRIQNKNGSIVGTVSLSSWWAPAGGNGPVDPRILYEQGVGRWLATCISNQETAQSSVLFAISATSDPTSAWFFYKIDADPFNVDWADFPNIGFNSIWIAITCNMYPIGGGAFSVDAAMWVISKNSVLGGGPAIVTNFRTGFDHAGVFSGDTVSGFSLAPCVTFGSSTKLYLVDNSGWTTGDGVNLVRLSELSGFEVSPFWQPTSGSSFPGTGLFVVANDMNGLQIGASQLTESPVNGIQTNDKRMVNSVFRNDAIWCTHSGGLPSTGLIDQTAVFWYKLNPFAMSNPIIQSGVVSGGPGVHMYYPSITVNSKEDVLLGFTRSSSALYAQAAYTGRRATDAWGSMKPVSVLKLGQDTYIKDFGTVIRWGDYSATCVDPTNDIEMWTIQEYAEVDVGPNPNDDRWGTWWGLACECIAKSGDANADAVVNLADLQSILNYIFNAPGWPPCSANARICWLSGLECRGDVNGNGVVAVNDVIYLANYIFAKPCPVPSDPTPQCWTPMKTCQCCQPVP